LNKEFILQLLCDLGCATIGRESIGEWERSLESDGLVASDIVNLLCQQTGREYSEDLQEWAEWAFEELEIDLASPEGSLLQSIKIDGKVLKIMKKRGLVEPPPV